MALENVVSLQFTPAELQEFNDAVNILHTKLLPKLTNLTLEQRKRGAVDSFCTGGGNFNIAVNN